MAAIARRPRILVIDDDATIPALVASLDSSWEIIVAVDGLRALDLLEQRTHDDQAFDLVILDIEMPDLDGFDTCLQLRTLDRTVPILPLTRHHHHALLERYAIAGLCELPVRKDVALTALTRRIVQALHAPTIHPLADDVVWERLQHKSLVAVRAARQQRAQVRHLAIFGRTIIQQAGLRHVVVTVDHVSVNAVVASQEELIISARQSPLHMVVAQAADTHDALAASRAVALPVLVIVSSVAEGQTVLAALENAPRSVPPTGVLLLTNTIPPTLALAIAALAEGRRFVDAALVSTPANVVRDIARQSAAFAELPPRQAEVVALDLLGWSSQDIAQALHIEPRTITTYWKRIYERLRMNRDEVRAWAQHRLATLSSPQSRESSPHTSPDEDSKAA
jgi:DNA-binding NarL/FixJ family response regulator